jgi:hypothetical protein
VHNRPVLRAVAWLLPLLVASSARAQCLAPEGSVPALAERNPEERFAYLSRVLERERHDASVWNWGWGIGFAASALGEGGFALFSTNRDQRIDATVGAIQSTLGVALSIIAPLRIEEPPAQFTSCADLVAAEAAMLHSLENERLMRAWYAHAGNLVVNAAGFFYLGFAEKHWLSGTVGLVGGLIVGELKIFTQPYRLPGAWETYRSHGFGPVQITITPIGDQLGLGVLGTF